MSIVRIITMMLGEMDFLSTFLQPILDYQQQEVFSKQMIAATWFLIMFAILMPILLMNLLIGLAVGDIETVRCNGEFFLFFCFVFFLTISISTKSLIIFYLSKNFQSL